MNTSNLYTLAGVFQDYNTADIVARQLKDAGYAEKNIQVTNDRDTAVYGGRRVSHDEGGVAGFFRKLFGSEDDSSYYEREVHNGRAVVTVDTTNEGMDRAIDIMNRNGAIAVETGGRVGDGEQRAGRTMTETGDRAVTAGDRGVTAGDRAVPVIQEELQVGKRVVSRGGVRVFSRVVEQPVEQDVTLREEHVQVDRHAVDRPVSAADVGNLRDETIEVLETAEEPVVRKQARVVEEVSLSKNVTEHTEKVRDSVRRTEVNVENVNEANRTGTPVMDDSEFRRDYDARYANSGYGYDIYAPAYQYGYTAANDPRYRGRSWSDAEAELQREYMREYPNSTWENIRGAVRYGWEKITGRLSHA